MKLNVCESYHQLSRNVSNYIVNFLSNNREALFCFAAGESPLQVFNYLVDASQGKLINLDYARFIGLDEWVGLNANDSGSCRNTLDSHLFHPLKISSAQINFFNGRGDKREECKKINSFLKNEGPVDLALLGIGLNGHVGFNEPGSPRDSLVREVELKPETLEEGKKYFKTEQILNKGLTLGMKQILESKNIILIASGEKKAKIVQKILQSPPTNILPATFMKEHSHCQLFVDQKAYL